uniref:Uncharacterized protein n=1 Tax=Triticum urartu TaxID=4572 RepID=A0A8R7TYQ4_TRIUA
MCIVTIYRVERAFKLISKYALHIFYYLLKVHMQNIIPKVAQTSLMRVLVL